MRHSAKTLTPLQGQYLPFIDVGTRRTLAGRMSNHKVMRGVVIGIGLISSCAFGQTTRTNPSASATIRAIPSSSSTSPNTPCASSNPTSPCYSVGAPRSPCYSAVGLNQPCSAASVPYSQTSPTPSPSADKMAQRSVVHALTKDQATAKILAKGYSHVANLRRDAEGGWRGKAEKDGATADVRLDRNGNVTATTP